MPTFYGTSGNDNILGSRYSDAIYAGSGNDWINGGLGRDFLYGNGGDDVFWWDSITTGSGWGYGLIHGGWGYDLIDMSNFTLSHIVYDDADAIVWVGNQAFDFVAVEEIWLSGANDVLDDPLGITATSSPLAIFTGGGNDYAHLAGAVTLNAESGNDTIRITGVINAGFTISATVYGGSGIDTLRLDNGFTVDLHEGTAESGDSIYYLDGIEDVQGVARANPGDSSIIYGNDLANKMIVWSDTATVDSLGVDYFGYGGNDFLGGSRGQDLLEGGAGADMLYGYAGNDTLRGGDDNDRIWGDAGSDYIHGGLGFDQVSGGSGADDFVFLALAESTSTATWADRIADFSHAEFDLIDVSSIDAVAGTSANEAFRFLGTGAFTGTKGELRYAFDTNGDTLVQLDVNGDQVADMMIRLIGHHDLVAGDFVL